MMQVTIYAVITFFMIGFQITAAKFFWYWLIMFLTLVLFTCYGEREPPMHTQSTDSVVSEGDGGICAVLGSCIQSKGTVVVPTRT
jgi:hypothetical protein